jgi:tRNA (cytidine/uridine-2'-O-)-methyltransferase
VYPSLNVVLVAPEIPQNTGNIGRLCLAADARLHLVEPLGFEIDEKQLRRAGLDYWDRVDVRIWSSFAELCSDAVGGARFWFFTTKAQRNYWDIDYAREDYLVFGRETKGLPESMLAEHAESCVTIPMAEDVRSINLATSVGIGTYEALRSISMD